MGSATRTPATPKLFSPRAVLVALSAAALVLAALGLAGARPAMLTVAVLAAAELARWQSRSHPGAQATAALVVIVAALKTNTAPLAVLAAVGLGAATGVDLVDRRIPTFIANGTALLSGMAMTAVLLSARGPGATASMWLSASVVVSIYAGVWFFGGVGFGDVRLAGATVSAAAAGLHYVALMVAIPVLVLPVIAAGWRLAGRRPPVPFGPALTTGWLVALSALSL